MYPRHRHAANLVTMLQVRVVDVVRTCTEARLPMTRATAWHCRPPALNSGAYAPVTNSTRGRLRIRLW